MSRPLLLALALPFLAPLGCGGGPEEVITDEGPTACDKARDGIAACLGTDVESPFTTCTTAEEQDALSLLDQLRSSGCNGPDGKTDGAFCSSWDPMGWCDAPAPPLGSEPRGKAAKYPILLAHGFNTSTTNFWAFNKVDTTLRQDGHDVTLGSVPPFDSSKVRAAKLKTQVDAILKRTGKQKVNLVCFSQGGVDCRWLASPGGLNYGSKIASLTMISSPNRGTNLGDAGVALLPNAKTATGRLVDLFASWYGKSFSTLAADSHFIDALKSMSEAEMANFNRVALDAPGIYYQSWAGFSYVGGIPNPVDTIEDDCRDENGVSRILWHEGRRDVMDPLLVGGAAFVAHGTELRPNDGVSTVQSAKWGRFRGCIPADHLDQVGQVKDKGSDRRTGFDYLRFYRTLAYELAAMGY